MDQTDKLSMQICSKIFKLFSLLGRKAHLSRNSLVNLLSLPSLEAETRSLDAIHGLKLAQGLHRVDMFLLRGPLDSVGLAVVLLLSLHQGLLLRSFHPPGNGGHIEVLHALVLLILGGRDVGGLHRGNHRVHQIFRCLDEGHGTVQPGDDQLSSQVLNLGLDLAADVKLVAIQGDTLQVR